MTTKVLKEVFFILFRAVTLLVAVSIIAFTLVNISPIDPIRGYVGAGVAVSAEQRENIEEYWGINDPPVERYLSWAKNVLKGDFGVSTIYRRDVIDVIGDKFLNSVALMTVAWIFSGVMGFTFGVFMGLFKNKPIDKILKGICLTLSSTPTFWLGLLFMMVFSLWLKWFPVGLSIPVGVLSNEITLSQKIHHMILPALTLGFAGFANIALHTREKLIEVMESDFVLFAKARGETRWYIVKNHGIRNAAIPALTLQFSSFSELFGGSVLAEQVFSYPGLGQAAVQAGLKNDIPLLLGITIFSVLFVFLGNLIANILYGVVNPNTRENY